MIDIFVIRGDGSRRGPDINEPLLTSLAAALNRGQVEIDSNTPMRTVQLSANFHSPGVYPGQLLEVVDSFQGMSWRGKVTSVDNAIEGVVMSTKLTLERFD